jgi:uncharacterized membrane protein YtjA (UPF0391 family)
MPERRPWHALVLAASPPQPLVCVGQILHGLQRHPYSHRTGIARCWVHAANGPRRRRQMLHYAIVFFVIALIAALLGFTGIAAGAAGIAKILFGVFLIFAIVIFIFGNSRRT